MRTYRKFSTQKISGGKGKERRKMMSKADRAGSWKPSSSHTSKSMGGEKHFDVEKYDDRGDKDSGAGKLHISGDSHQPSMTDIHHSK